MKLPLKYDKIPINERKLVRNEYVKIQHGKCYCCKELLSNKPAKHILSKKINKSLFPDNFFKWPIHLHHDHSSGLTIGAVHANCNAVLWQYYGE